AHLRPRVLELLHHSRVDGTVGVELAAQRDRFGRDGYRQCGTRSAVMEHDPHAEQSCIVLCIRARTPRNGRDRDGEDAREQAGHAGASGATSPPGVRSHRAHAGAAATTPAMTSSNFTPTIRLTPASSIVTPYSQSAASMVRGWCVMTTNCVRSLNRWSMAMNRPMFASSRGASTSSSTQNGLGFTR